MSSHRVNRPKQEEGCWDHARSSRQGRDLKPLCNLLLVTSLVKPVQEPKCLLFSAVALCHRAEISPNKMYFKNRQAKPRGGSSSREGATVHPSFAFLQPACSVLLGMCADSPFCLTAVCWC